MTDHKDITHETDVSLTQALIPLISQLVDLKVNEESEKEKSIPSQATKVQPLTPSNNLDQKSTCSLIKLNVGGYVFFTTMATLTSPSADGSYFEKLFLKPEENIRLKDKQNEVFIDRDPTMFRYILNSLRGINPDLSLLSTLEKKDLAVEATFYNMHDLVKRINQNLWYAFQPGPFYKVFNHGLTVANCCGDEDKWVTIAGPEMSVGSKVTIRLLSTPWHQMAIGLSRSTLNQGIHHYYPQILENGYYYMISLSKSEKIFRKTASIQGWKSCTAGTTIEVSLGINKSLEFRFNGVKDEQPLVIPVDKKYYFTLVLSKNAIVELVPDN